jgi:filamentous hemagglutinin family protein
MMLKVQNLLPKFFIFTFLLLSATPAKAQITPDNTLGAERSVFTTNTLIQGKGINADSITGGAQRGRNLFHSFSDFNVIAGQKVYFANPSDVTNILTRVTGGNQSSILGTLGVDGGANLFLINPAGILFGKNASLDLKGSFVGTTANGVQFGTQGLFSATNPQAPPLLTIDPSALLFNQLNQGATITNQSTADAGVNPLGNNTTGLRVADGNSLILVGGNVNLDGGSLRAYGGRVELAGLAASGSVGLNIAGNTLSLSVPSGVQRADVSISNAAISVFANGGGNIAINARNLQLSNSFLFAGITGMGSGNANTAGDINLNATEKIVLAQGSQVDNRVYSNTQGNGGNININTGSLTLQDGSQLSTPVFGQGNGGNININTASLAVQDGSQLSTPVFGQGNGGNININTASLAVQDGSQLSTPVFGQGNGGNIIINARDTISLDGKSSDNYYTRLQTSVQSGGVGKAGDIEITTGSLSLTNGAFLSSDILGNGTGGNITINASNAVTFEGSSSAESAVFKDAVGKGGDIKITTGSLSLTNGSQLYTSVSGQGNAGNITIDARDTVNLDGVVGNSIGGVQSDLLSGGVGKAGNIQITTGSLSLTNGAAISSDTYGRGNAGNIILNARETITFDSVGDKNLPGGRASSTVGSNGIGNAGNISVNARALFLKNGGQLNAESFGQGNAGNITINTADTVAIDGVGINGLDSGVGTFGNGNGGDIQLSTGTLSLTNGGKLSSFSSANAGNITVNARDAITIDGIGSNRRPSWIASSLQSGGAGGKGGDIQLTTNSLTVSDGGQLLSFTSGRGNAGNINVTTGSFSLTNGSKLLSGTAGRGNGGNITINARDSVRFDGAGNSQNSTGAYSTVESRGAGNAGNINVTTRSLSLNNGAQISASTSGQGNAGNITIDAGDSVKFDGAGNSQNPTGAYSTVESGGVGNAGNINVTTGSLSLNNGAQISATTVGQGNGGDISINARDSITLNGRGSNGRSSGVFSEVGTGGVGKAGNLSLTTGSFSLQDGAVLNSGTFGQGNAGNILVQASKSVSLTNSSFITSSIYSGGIGNSGDIDINTKALTLSSGSQIGAVVFRQSGNLPGGRGTGGNIRINASDSVNLSGIGSTGFSSGLLTLSDRGASGDAGSIYVTTGDFRVTDGAIVSAATYNSGKAGDITINANTLEAFNGGQIVALTRSTGSAGNIRLYVKDSITLAGIDPHYAQRLALIEEQLKSSGSTDIVSDVVANQGAASGIFANTAFGSTGAGGSIFIDPRQVTIKDGAAISVSSDGTGNAGNIVLDIDDYLLLRNGGKISTSAGTNLAPGNGGNITINTPFVIAVPKENSNITANAFSGSGGKININAQLFGIEARSKSSDQDPTNVISASSQLGVQGQVNVAQPQVELIQGLIELPIQVSDAATKFSQLCPNSPNAKPLGEFVITGKGNIPPNPLQLLPGRNPDIPLATAEDMQEIRSIQAQEQKKKEEQEYTSKVGRKKNKDNTLPAIVEAQGIVQTPDGQIYFVANANHATPSSQPTASVCPSQN